MQVPKELETFRLNIPEQLLNYNWDEAIKVNQGETVKLLKVCKMQGEMLQRCSNWPVNPETLTWLTLWTRNFNLLQGAISILESTIGIAKTGQEFALRILWRPAFELWVTLNFILTESVGLSSTPGTEKHTLTHRMCAYLAWCLWNDEILADNLTQGARLSTLFSNGEVPTHEDAQRLNQGLEFLWGDKNAHDSAGDRQTKHLVRVNSLNKRNLFLKWLQHEKLRDFVDQIRNKKLKNYFALVDPENQSLAGLLRPSWIDAGYPAYQEASALIHGSTFIRHMELIGDHIFPNIAAADEIVQRQASHIRRHCNFNAVTIQGIKNRMEKEGLI